VVGTHRVADLPIAQGEGMAQAVLGHAAPVGLGIALDEAAHCLVGEPDNDCSRLLWAVAAVAIAARHNSYLGRVHPGEGMGASKNLRSVPWSERFALT
jgi:hypothetical protein